MKPYSVNYYVECRDYRSGPFKTREQAEAFLARLETPGKRECAAKHSVRLSAFALDVGTRDPASWDLADDLRDGNVTIEYDYPADDLAADARSGR